MNFSSSKRKPISRSFDFEIFSKKLLEEAYLKATLPTDLEHVTPYIHQNRSGHVKFKNIKHSQDKSNYRITLDTMEDWILIQKLMQDHGADEMSFLEIMNLLDRNKELTKINSNVKQRGFE